MSNLSVVFCLFLWRAFFYQSTPKFSDLGVALSGLWHLAPSRSRPLILAHILDNPTPTSKAG